MTADKTRVLVTGGAGFVGANLVRMLLRQDFKVTVLDDLSEGKREYLTGLPIDFTEGNILDRAVLNQLVPAQAGIIHLAAQTGVPGSLDDPRHDCETNVIGTLNLLEACRAAQDSQVSKARGPRMVLASSNAPLGRQMAPASEDKAPLPIAPYGASKLAAEGYCLAYHGSWQLSTVVLRFANVYGPFSAHKNSVVAKFFKDMASDGEITVDGDGGQTRDFIHVDDLCRAVVLALQSDVSGEVFQIATGVESSIMDVAMLVQEVVGEQVAIRHGPPRQGDIRKNYSTIAKVRKMLGWEPRISLRTGLSESWTWFEEYLANGGS